MGHQDSLFSVVWDVGGICPCCTFGLAGSKVIGLDLPSGGNSIVTSERDPVAGREGRCPRRDWTADNGTYHWCWEGSLAISVGWWVGIVTRGGKCHNRIRLVVCGEKSVGTGLLGIEKTTWRGEGGGARGGRRKTERKEAPTGERKETLAQL